MHWNERKIRPDVVQQVKSSRLAEYFLTELMARMQAQCVMEVRP